MTDYDVFEDTDQIIDMVDAQRAAADPDNQLVALQDQMSDVADPTINMDVIIDGINYIEETHPELSPVLDDMYNATGELVKLIELHRQTVEAAAALALTFRQQREAAQQAFAELREALENWDMSNPAIAMMLEEFEAANQESMFEYVDEVIIENIMNNTQLSEEESRRIYTLISGGGWLELDDPHWETLKAWIASAQIASDAAYETWKARIRTK